MGFLDHSTNNILVDAVLTDYGRQKLSESGQLNISYYTFADDEVDYTIIKKYGPIIGKEKIEKNTPIFEATTASSYGYRYPLLSSPDDITAYPILSLAQSGDALTSDTSTRTIAVTYTIPTGGTAIDLVGSNLTLYISFDNRFVSLDSGGSVLTSAQMPAGLVVGSTDSFTTYASMTLTAAGSTYTNNLVFKRNSGGVNYTSLLTGGEVSVPVTVIAKTSGLRATEYLSSTYTTT